MTSAIDASRASGQGLIGDEMVRPSQHQDVQALVDLFSRPPARFGPVPLWWWSGDRVTRERLRTQLDRMVEGGIRQAVVINLAPAGPQYGSIADDPPFMSNDWWSILQGVCADAEERGFSIWLYDQIGFSGANIQGHLVAAQPRFAGRAIDRTVVHPGSDERVVVEAPGDARALMAYAIRTEDALLSVLPVSDRGVDYLGPAARVVLVHEGPRGFDYLEPEACAALIDAVHGEYERHLGAWFGRTVIGFFQDELQSMPSWSGQFATTFESAYGYDLVPRLWALWEDRGDAAAVVRRDYEEHRAGLARRAFFEPQAVWLRQRGLVCGFDQASPARDGDPIGGVELYADYLATHSTYSYPGSDHWGNTKIHSSLAHANGRERTWLEAFHSSGWGGTIEETYEWLAPFFRRGATLYNPHAIYYTLRRGWWEWAAPSTCWRQPYWPSYHVFAKAVSRLCAMLSAGVHICDTVLLSPSTTAQAYLTLDGALPPGVAARDGFLALDGVGAWAWERPGILDRAAHDYDVLDEQTIGRGRVVDGRLAVGDELYCNVVVPNAAVLVAEAAAVLVDLAASGGTVICVGAPPRIVLRSDGSDSRLADRLAEAAVAGRVSVVPDPEDVPAMLRRDRALITADVPLLHRRVGDVDVVLLAAHDEGTGTLAPIMAAPEPDWAKHGFPYRRYWKALGNHGYSFRPTGNRVCRVSLGKDVRRHVQRWDPRTGERVDLRAFVDEDGNHVVNVPLPGPMALLVLGDALPAPTSTLPKGLTGRQLVPGPWLAEATSTLDNGSGDLAGPEVPSRVPIQVWRFEHALGWYEYAQTWVPAIATYGHFADVFGPCPGPEQPRNATWRSAVWSLSRGIWKDPYHVDQLGPKGHVPEAFLDWREVKAGEWVGVRTTLAPTDPSRVVLAVTANANRVVSIDGVEARLHGVGSMTTSPWPSGSPGEARRIEVRFQAVRDGPIRVAFALVADVDMYRRPEWLTPPGLGVPGRVWDFRRDFDLDSVPREPSVTVGSDGPCSIAVNGVAVGCQGDFQPYPGNRELRVHRYDLGRSLRPGRNVLVVRVVDRSTVPTGVLVDSLLRQQGGLGLISGSDGWLATDGQAVHPVTVRRDDDRDLRSVCAWLRPHPLPGANWLDPEPAAGGVVEAVIPDVAPGPPRIEQLRFVAPLGATDMAIPTSLPVTVTIGDAEIMPVDGWVRLQGPAPPGTRVVLSFDARDGRRGGALLDGPISVRTVETNAVLDDWEALGLRALGGSVAYRTTFQTLLLPGRRYTIDLGSVRGAADVLVNGALVDRLVWSPWSTEITDFLHRGENDLVVVVRGTLAGYLDDSSPTVEIAAGQARAGLYGPVTILTHDS